MTENPLEYRVKFASQPSLGPEQMLAVIAENPKDAMDNALLANKLNEALARSQMSRAATIFEAGPKLTQG